MNSPKIRLLLVVALWGAAAALAGHYNLIDHLPRRTTPILIASLAVLSSVALARVGWLRASIEQVSGRTIVATHLVRFIGFYFLWLHAQGRLPVEFAQRAGWGDVAAATGALLLLFWPEGRGFRRAVLWWNGFGLLDLLIAVGTAAWLNTVRPGSMDEVRLLPLTLVPLWLVPMALATHIHLFRQAAITARSAGRSAARS